MRVVPPHQRRCSHRIHVGGEQACGGGVVQALALAEQRDEVEELRLDDQRHVQILRDHVDAQWENCDAPEESARERVGCVC